MANQQKPSQSAIGVAIFRAVEAQKPAAVRICNDPYAGALVPGLGTTLVKWVIDSGLYNRMAPGAAEYIILRERYIDDWLTAALTEGLDQVVLLGAGLDTRAYRLPGIEKTRVFEVDQPASQADKLARLRKVIHPLPAHVTFVPVDFNTQALGEQLAGAGYNEHAKTAFIWQGVTYFLTAAGVDGTLAFIAQHSGPGSVVIFDYFYNETLRDPTVAYTKALRRAGRLSGEAYMFGIDHGQVEVFLAQRGFRDAHNLPLDEIKQRYFTGPNAGRPVPPGIAIVSARTGAVKESV